MARISGVQERNRDIDRIEREQRKIMADRRKAKENTVISGYLYFPYTNRPKKSGMGKLRVIKRYPNLGDRLEHALAARDVKMDDGMRLARMNEDEAAAEFASRKEKYNHGFPLFRLPGKKAG